MSKAKEILETMEAVDVQKLLDKSAKKGSTGLEKIGEVIKELENLSKSAELQRGTKYSQFITTLQGFGERAAKLAKKIK